MSEYSVKIVYTGPSGKEYTMLAASGPEWADLREVIVDYIRIRDDETRPAPTTPATPGGYEYNERHRR